MKKIFITGTSRGIGQELANYYCSQGYTVFGCSRNPASIQHANYTHFSLDLKDSQAISKCISDNFHLLNDLDILINNAGLAAMSPTLLADPQQFKNIFEVNFFAPFNLIQQLSRGMIKKKQGRIINFSTVLNSYNYVGHMAYALSKNALEVLTTQLSAEMAAYGITLNAIGITLLDTDMTKNMSESIKSNFLAQQPIPRKGSVKDIIHLCDFYIHPQSDFISGQVVYLGGVPRRSC